MKRIREFMIILAVVCMLLPVCAGAQTMYVKTQSGGAVNLRDEPSTDSESIAKLAYGTKVEVLSIESGWARIRYSGRKNPAYMASKYLSTENPGSKPQPNTNKEKKKREPESMANMNFSSFKLVEPYYVTVHASHTGGYVNLRWAPSKNASVAHRVNDTSELLVIAEGKDWKQVRDERSGYTGFMQASFLVKEQ